MSNDQQPVEKISPTIWSVLGIGGLVGVIMGIVLILIAPVVKSPLGIVLFTTMPAIFGAGIGSHLPNTHSSKWYGLWIGAVSCALLPIGFFLILLWGGLY